MGAPAWRDPIFLAELRRRLGVPDAARDTWCPRCDGILDAHSHHAGMCLAGGDRTRRHHAARGLVAAWATCAGLAPELEKAELLLPQWPDDARLALRRLADVYLPAFEGAPTALVLAITGRLRLESLAEAGRHALAASGVYAHLKKSHLKTAQLCTAQGVRFRPMVAESTGAWDSEASQILQLIARGVSAREGRHPAATGTLPPPKPLFSKSFRSPSAAAMGSAQSPGYFGCCNHGCRRSRAGPCRRSVRTP